MFCARFVKRYHPNDERFVERSNAMRKQIIKLMLMYAEGRAADLIEELKRELSE